MSAASAMTEQDIWEFVSCSCCHLPFSPDGRAPPVPFWLTECGHILCNNHLTPDQACTACGSKPVQMVPLQRELEPPLSDWFRSLPYSLDALAQAAKFQQELLCTLVRYYKTKCIQQRNVLERLRGEREDVKSMKKRIQELIMENEQVRRSLEYSGARSSFSLNSNGKRRMTDAYRRMDSGHSSPRSAATPIGPVRLTLPPDQQQAAFTNRTPHNYAPGQSHDRLGSSHFAQYDSTHHAPYLHTE
ncbi:hypothetical protein K488DRAFT_56498 [Vararia minispora EC-137]|uniref:Uncharacterized protein n=1 Tax=Vararia minispora EC-137 TaxID=1314806 RepID=A0ACB8QCC7_9AGAM|nr:hypothetical protein K488DRAFT_56498 [Vararia minispora EC-137]